LSTMTVKSAMEMSFEPLVLRTKHPFGISYGTTTDSTNVLVKLRYEGHEGVGEGSPVEYHNESPSTAMAVLKDWSESGILGCNPFEISEICKRLDKDISGNFAAKSAVEMALHDLVGKLVGQPTWRLLGFENAKYPMTDFTIGIDSLDVVEKKTIEAVEAGYKMLKVKQGTAFDKEIIQRVRKHAPNLPLRVDANGGWTVKQAIRMSHFLAEHGVEFIEQPLPKHALVSDFRIVREQSAIPIFADESICRSYDVAKFAGAIDGVVVKLAKTGGLLEAIKVIHTARAHGMQVMFGCMIESSVGISAAAQLQSLCDYLDLDGAMLLANDPYSGAEYKDGYLMLPDRPGLGVLPRA
jgi:L-alanine-DL-glutamate epimerase-like enolase superfamily enzyme